MATNTTYKAGTILNSLVDLLTLELATNMPVVTKYTDALGNPYVIFSAAASQAAGAKNVLIRVQPLSWTNAKDILGNTAIQYTGHVIQIETEANSTGVGSGGTGGTGPAALEADVLAPADLLPVLIECGRTGCWVDWYTTPYGTAPTTVDGTTAALTGGTLQASWKNLFWTIQTAT